MLPRLLAVHLLLGLVLASCATGTETVLSSDPGCIEPPPSERQATSDLALTVDPNPVIPGSEAILSLSSEGLPFDAIVGAGAAWQCWNGSGWVDTHQIVRGFMGDPETLAVEPGVTTTIPAVGLPIPNAYPILIPEVAPGIYRIEDSVESLTGFVIVEVR